MSLGLFADGVYGDGFNGVPGTVKGLLYGDSSQFFAQCIGTLTNFVFIFAISWLFFKVQDLVMGIRVSAETEVEGLDIPEVGALAYPDFSVLPAHGVPAGHKAMSSLSPSMARTAKEVS
ncbi:MAG: hypothetical protein ACREJ6_08820 [Candidatus Methylomirabilis sp.]